MLSFCPTCGNVLFTSSVPGILKLVCNICPFMYNITSEIRIQTYYKLKEIDDILGGEEAWENVNATQERCPKCFNPKAYFMQIQTRSADEPMTTFYRCFNRECSFTWRN